MILDSSAIIAVINKEPEKVALERALSGVDDLKIGAPTLVEATMVLVSRFGIRGRTVAARFVQEWEIHQIEFDSRHADVAIDAFHRFGRGRHPAKLNMGDCFSYATARLAREPLLCIGDDFARTDLELVALEWP